MDRLKIRAISLPVRCSVCHKSDHFDSSTNYCSRCDSYTLTQSANKDYFHDSRKKNLNRSGRERGSQALNFLDNVVRAVSVFTAIMIALPPILLVIYCLIVFINFFTLLIDFGFRLNFYGEFIATVAWICFGMLAWGLLSAF